jgi:hypothetical protein
MKTPMKSIAHIFIFLLIAAAFSACDKIDEPYLRETGPVEEGTRVVLLEDFTGHKCVYCPDAAVIAEEIYEAHPKQVIVVSVHAGYYATVDLAGDFTYDFNTTEGTELYDFFKVADYGNPQGLISRIPETASKWVIAPANWKARVNNLLKDQTIANIRLNPTYNEITRELTTDINVTFLHKSDTGYNIVAIITEDSIVKPQKKIGVGTIPDYLHRNVLRGSFNGTWGTNLANAPILANDVYNKSFSKVLDPAWNADQCSIIAYIYNKKTLEVMQAGKVKIK